MSDASVAGSDDPFVPDTVIPRGNLEPLRYRDLPKPVPLRRMLGPSVILAGTALGSGEFVFWPFLTSKSGFVFFWACLVGVTIQYFINMEVIRWTLATGESALTGFIRMSRHWGWIFLLLNIIPWMIPAWASGAAQLISWLTWGVTFDEAGVIHSAYVTPLAIGGLVVCGLVLTAGPVIYETMERIQFVLVALVMILVVVLSALLVRGDAVVAMATSLARPGLPEMGEGITAAVLLGALAFAGAGGTLNLGQSNYIKDKGWGMGRMIGRITSPITGHEEAVAEIGYHFPDTEENRRRWSRWWRSASIEHLLSFYLTCVVTLVLLSLVSYSIFFTPEGTLRPEIAKYGQGMAFIYGEAEQIRHILGPVARVLFLLMGIAVLLTTEFGVLDVTSRISTDLVKVNWLKENSYWTESRLYYVFLWGTIVLGILFLLIGTQRVEGSFPLFKMTAALNGGVMFFYSATLLWMNSFRLPPRLRMSRLRQVVLAGTVVFFGIFAAWAAQDELQKWLS